MSCLSRFRFECERDVVIHMAKTFTICSWSLLALGTGVNFWLYQNPVILLPYLLLAFVIRAARHLTTRVLVLMFTLISVCVSFWFCWDAAFVHRSTLNFEPRDVAFVQGLLAGVLWLVVRRVERLRQPTTVAPSLEP